MTMNVQYEPARESHFVSNMALGGLTTAGWIAAEALKKSNRGDTFVNTSKNCIKSFAVENRDGAVKLAQKLKLNKAADWVSKLSNKKLAIGNAAIYTLIFGGLIGCVRNLFSD